LAPRAAEREKWNLLQFDHGPSQPPAALVTLQSTKAPRRSAMIRLIIAIAVGAVIAVGGVFILVNVLDSAANGTANTASIYQYGNR
jgi:hypothetical protein